MKRFEKLQLLMLDEMVNLMIKERAPCMYCAYESETCHNKLCESGYRKFLEEEIGE